MIEIPKIGDVLWCHDHRSNSKQWFEQAIKSETKQSWILGDGWSPYKVLKKDLTENMGAYGRRRWFTTQGRDEYLWINTHAREIGGLVQNIKDVAMLKKIAELIGYNGEKK